MKTGFYFIGIHDTDKDGNGVFIPKLEEGSVEYHGRLFIHREKDYKHNPHRWRLSHMNSGAVVVGSLNLASARLLAKKLQPFKVWDLRTFEEVRDACQGNNPVYEKEREQIVSIRFERA